MTARTEIKNSHDVPLVVKTPDEELTVPPGATVFIFTSLMTVRVTTPEESSTNVQGATP